jgi:hypothetical protein
MNIPDALFNRIDSLLSVMQSSCKGCYFRNSTRCLTCFAVPAKALHREIELSRPGPAPCITLNRPERILLRHILNAKPRADIGRVSIPGLEAYEKRRAIGRLLEKRLITVSGGISGKGKRTTLVSVNTDFLGQIGDILSARGD